MPSDDGGAGASAVAEALAVLAAPREAFDSALALTAEEIRGFLDSHTDSGSEGPDRLAAELGQFASDLIDADRFASLVGQREPVDVELLHDAERGWAGLLALRGRGEELHVVRVPEDADLVEVVKGALAEAGRAFRLARAARFVRNGSSQRDAPTTDPFPPHLWNRAERGLAPPLAIDVAGPALQVSGLGDLLVGQQKLILLVRSTAHPAPLARLIRPGLLVVQATDVEGLSGVADFDGPAVAAVMPQGGAVFSHDPRRGASYATRLVIESVPEAASTDQTVLEDLQHLKELGTVSRAAPEPDPAPILPQEPLATPTTSAAPSTMPAPPLASSPSQPEADATDRLAAWLLDQAGL